jgi:hypothetical protein
VPLRLPPFLVCLEPRALLHLTSAQRFRYYKRVSIILVTTGQAKWLPDFFISIALQSVCFWKAMILLQFHFCAAWRPFGSFLQSNYKVLLAAYSKDKAFWAPAEELYALANYQISLLFSNLSAFVAHRFTPGSTVRNPSCSCGERAYSTPTANSVHQSESHAIIMLLDCRRHGLPMPLCSGSGVVHVRWYRSLRSLGEPYASTSPQDS